MRESIASNVAVFAWKVARVTWRFVSCKQLTRASKPQGESANDVVGILNGAANKWTSNGFNVDGFSHQTVLSEERARVASRMGRQRGAALSTIPAPTKAIVPKAVE